MKNKITITGKISAILEKEYQGAKTTQVQFLMESDSKGIEVIKVKILSNDFTPENMQALVEACKAAAPQSAAPAGVDTVPTPASAAPAAPAAKK